MLSERHIKIIKIPISSEDSQVLLTYILTARIEIFERITPTTIIIEILERKCSLMRETFIWSQEHDDISQNLQR